MNPPNYIRWFSEIRSEDVALVGFSDHEWAVVTRPQLTAVVQPTDEIGRSGTRMLLERVEGRTEAGPRHLVIPPRLNIRESCGSGRRAELGELERIFGQARRRGPRSSRGRAAPAPAPAGGRPA